MNTIKPPKLNQGDMVGIISPSGFLNEAGQNQLQAGVAFLKSLGFRIKYGKNILKRHFYSAGTAEERVADFHDMFLDNDVRAIFQTQGGETANEMLEHIDWNIVKNNPKPFGGMSDGTTLILAIYAKTGTVAIHGPDVAWGYGRGASDYEKESLLKVLSGEVVGDIQPDKEHKVSDDAKNSSKHWKCWKGGVAEGKLIGGNLSVIERFHGTAYAPDYSGSILFLEDVGHTPEQLANKFTHLKLTGIFDKIGGVVLGYFSKNVAQDPGENRPIGEVFLEITKDYTFPVLEIGEIGHNIPNTNLPVGIKAKLDATNLKLTILESALN